MTVERPPDGRQGSPAVDSAARILELLSRYRTRASTLSEIAAALDLPKSTALRILRTLQAHSLVQHDEETRRYQLGFFTAVLGSRAAEGLDSFTRTRPFLVEISERTGLTAALIQRASADRLMYVAKQHGVGPSTVHISVGNRFPMFEVSFSRWWVAFSAPEEREALVPATLPAVTDRAPTDREAYLRDCAELGPHSVLVTRDEYVPGVFTSSCAALDPRGQLEGVVVALGFSQSVDDAAERTVRAVMADAAVRLNTHGAL
ncbi:IclR family transcriptional regulator [Pseudonocardia sp. NPDC049154]|uniref:IclR family transcriptional regulator n=1 Tax=Pseudonocardia sp. NPDC049154 TaxID=3155501 RepID=UPI0033D0821D